MWQRLADVVLRLGFVSKGRILNPAAVRTDSHERPWLWDSAEAITVTRTQDQGRRDSQPGDQGETEPPPVRQKRISGQRSRVRQSYLQSGKRGPQARGPG